MSNKTKAEEKKSAVELAQEKADQLTEEYKAKGVYKVHPVVFRIESTNEDVVGFFKEPSRAAKIAVMDKSVIGAYGVVEEILDSVLLKEHSDPRLWSEDQAYDDIHNGLIMAVYGVIRFKPNTAKKK